MRIAARIALLVLAAALVAGFLWKIASSRSEQGVGKPAPPTQGTDAEGVAFQLSDYHDKVVMLDFWADWCPHCRAMYSHDKKIVERYQKRPFVLLGVNADADVETLKEVQERQHLTWRSWFDGPPKGPLTEEWKIQGFPTICLLDAAHVVRYEHVGAPDGDELDAEIEKLVQEAEK